jgi:Na+-transporting NADH:ubiquinone oxidoreductase subunit NqrB
MTTGTRSLLRLEALVALCAAVITYRSLGGTWALFFSAFLAPDLSFVGYLAGAKVGAVAYNAMHSYVGPALLGAAGLFFGAPVALQLALIWVAHVGFDRSLGYGLKSFTGFNDTHLGRIGKSAKNDALVAAFNR